MIYLFLATLCSYAIALILKFSEFRNLNRMVVTASSGQFLSEFLQEFCISAASSTSRKAFLITESFTAQEQLL